MFQRILKCDYEFVAPWWDEVSENAKVGRNLTVEPLYVPLWAFLNFHWILRAFILVHLHVIFFLFCKHWDLFSCIIVLSSLQISKFKISLSSRLNDQTFLSNVEFVCDGWNVFGENVWCRSNTESHPMLREARLNGKAYVLPTRCRTKRFDRLTGFMSLISLNSVLTVSSLGSCQEINCFGS